MDLKLSYPAVSQIYNLIFLLSIASVFAPNSTPIVTSWLALNLILKFKNLLSMN